MKKIYILTVIISFLFLTSCEDDNDDINKINVFDGGVTYENLYAPSSKKGNSYMPVDQKGEFVKFNFNTGKITTSKTDWDIAFRYATIVLNGGGNVGYSSEPQRNGNVKAYIIKTPFNKVTKVDENKLKTDSSNGLAILDDVQSGQGLWSYNMKEHYVLPIPGRTLVIKTRNGKFIKMKVLSFYKDAPTQPKIGDTTYGYYTFVYKTI